MTPETVMAGPSVQKNAETSVSQSEMPLKIKGGPSAQSELKKPDSSAYFPFFRFGGVSQDWLQTAT